MAGCYKLTVPQVKKSMLYFNLDKKMGKRNKALMMWGILSGFRISEILALQRGHIISENGVIQNKVTISAKKMKGSKKARTVVFSKTAKKYVLDWLIEQQQNGFDHKCQYVFAQANGKKLSRKRAWEILKKCFAHIGLPSKGYATHSLRKTFASDYIESCKSATKKEATFNDSRALQKILGHANLETTLLYLENITPNADSQIINMGKKYEK